MFYEQHVSSELQKDVPDALLLGSDNDISLTKPSAVKIPLRLEDLIAGEAWKEKPNALELFRSCCSSSHSKYLILKLNI